MISWGDGMKMRDFEAGRLSGLEMALKIVKQGGVEALEKELKFRGKTGINTPFKLKDLEEASQQIKEMTLDTMMVLSVAVLHDEFDFGQKRCQRFIDRATKIASSLIDDMASWDDYRQMIKDDMGIEMKIRVNE